MMKKFVCSICGYVHEGDSAPEQCPQCKAPASKFVEQAADHALNWADEHRVGVAKDVDPEIVDGLKMNFMGECTEVGMYLAMARVAHLLHRFLWHRRCRTSNVPDFSGDATRIDEASKTSIFSYRTAKAEVPSKSDLQNRTNCAS